jgi:glutamine amidotransferase
MIVIVDYGVGNVGSVQNMLRRVGRDDVAVSRDPDVVARAEKLILPGVGAFDRGMEHIEGVKGLRDALDEVALRRRQPVLGVCLGMQLLGKGSEEGTRAGLGWIDARCVGFRGVIPPGLKVPHMGWNGVTSVRRHPLVDSLPEQPRFYFVHSYFMRCEDRADVLLEASHGVTFACAVQRDNVMGVQFHPEKSHKYGVALLAAFAGL